MVIECSQTFKKYLYCFLSSFSSCSSYKKAKETHNDNLFKDQLLKETNMVTETNPEGYISYASCKFLEVTGYTIEELKGKTHKIISSGAHPKKIWDEMRHKTVKEKGIWYHPCIISKRKNGTLFYSKLWIRASFDDNGRWTGFISVSHDITDFIEQQKNVYKMNVYLDYASKIMRHDMRSGLDTYLSYGINSLKKKLSPEIIRDNDLSLSIKMVEDGLTHTKKVYEGVNQLADLIKNEDSFKKQERDLGEILKNYLVGTSYADKVLIHDLPKKEVSESLFCTAIDNLIKNGIKYNDSKIKKVDIYFDYKNNQLVIEDNGRGLDYDDFMILAQPYVRKPGQKESGTGLGLHICNAILDQHGLCVLCEKISEENGGTRVKICF